MAERTSAGILLYRRSGSNPDGRLEVLLAHPGGPFFAKRDLGDWTIPKGEPDGRHEPMLDAVARREFEEETGTAIDPATPADRARLHRPEGRQGRPCLGGRGRPGPGRRHGRTMFEIVWPPRSGKRESFPEIDRVAWFGPDEARRRIKPTQVPLIDRLEEALDGRAGSSR